MIDLNNAKQQLLFGNYFIKLSNITALNAIWLPYKTYYRCQKIGVLMKQVFSFNQR